MKRFWEISIVFVVIAIVPQFAWGDLASSTDFRIDSDVFGAGGGYATSTNFQLGGALGQAGVGVSLSSSFTVNGGFFYGPQLAIVVIPSAPSGLIGVPASPTQVNLVWTDNSGGSESGFSIERKIGASGTYAEVGRTTSGVANFSDTSAAAATIYFYRVRAFIGSSFSSYSNETSITTPAVPVNNGNSGGGGGGGGGGGAATSLPQAQASVSISGFAYPLSTVTVLQDAQVAGTSIAGPDGKFTLTINNLSGGNYIFSVYAEDDTGNRSSLFTFPVALTIGATTQISGVFIAATIGVDKQEVKQGDTIAIFGKSAPDAQVAISIHSAQTIYKTATSSASGAYIYDLDTEPLDLGSHAAMAHAALASMISDDSVSATFVVGDENVAATAQAKCPAKGDLNNDCKVNLVDFSILAYWYGRPNPPAKYDLNGDGKINLVDFSIMAYYWTG